MDGRDTVTHELLAGFPAGVLAADAELGALIAADELAFGTLDGAERYLGLAERATAAMPQARRAQAQLLLEIAGQVRRSFAPELPLAGSDVPGSCALARPGC